uniref:Uncharacterized protein n=1 Tax=Diplonema papillatum TaxID=91374 RepID=A0A1L6C404_9EUGL|nr:hypothetical protein [Diplonema papillatum]
MLSMVGAVSLVVALRRCAPGVHGVAGPAVLAMVAMVADGVVAVLLCACWANVLVYLAASSTTEQEYMDSSTDCHWLLLSVSMDMVLAGAVCAVELSTHGLLGVLVLKGWLHSGSTVLYAMYLSMDSTQLAILQLVGYIQLLLVVPTAKFFFFFFFFFSSCVVLCWATVLLYSMHTVLDLCMVPSLYSTSLAVGAMLCSSLSSTYVYMALASSALAVLVWYVVFTNSRDVAGTLLDTISTGTSTVMVVVGVQLMAYMGLMVCWYGMYKVELALTVLHTYHIFFFFFLVLSMVPWVYRAMAQAVRPIQGAPRDGRDAVHEVACSALLIT